jgi:hypothetical protein
MSLSVWYGVRLYLTVRPLPLTGLVKIFYRDGVLYFVIIGGEWSLLLYSSFTPLIDLAPAVLALTNALMSFSQGVRSWPAKRLTS